MQVAENLFAAHSMACQHFNSCAAGDDPVHVFIMPIWQVRDVELRFRLADAWQVLTLDSLSMP